MLNYSYQVKLPASWMGRLSLKIPNILGIQKMNLD